MACSGITLGLCSWITSWGFRGPYEVLRIETISALLGKCATHCTFVLVSRNSHYSCLLIIKSDHICDYGIGIGKLGNKTFFVINLLGLII